MTTHDMGFIGYRITRILQSARLGLAFGLGLTPGTAINFGWWALLPVPVSVAVAVLVGWLTEER